MALTKEDLKKIPGLDTLEDAILDNIAQASKNDEDNIVGAKFREQYDAIDKLVLDITGATKPQTTKTTEFLKMQLSSLKEKAANVDVLQTKVTDLEGKIASGGGDAALKSELELARNTLKAAQQQVAELTTAKTEIETKAQTALETFKAEAEQKELATAFKLATAGKAFKGVDENHGKRLLDLDISDILSTTVRESVMGIDGKPQMVFKDKATGLILTNPAKNMAPMTAEELILSRASGYLDLGKTAQGTGAKPGDTNYVPPVNGMADVSSAKTKVELNDAVTAQLLARGISTTDERFFEERNKLIEPIKDQFEKLPEGVL